MTNNLNLIEDKLIGRNNFAFVIVGPTASGKGTMMKMLQDEFKESVYKINNKVDDSTLNILPQSLCIPQTKSLSCEKQIFIIPDNAITKTKQNIFKYLFK